MNRLTSILATTFAVVAIAASTSRGGFDVFEGDFVKLANGNGYPGGIFDVNVLFPRRASRVKSVVFLKDYLVRLIPTLWHKYYNGRSFVWQQYTR